MAQMMIKPQVASFLNAMTSSGGPSFEEILVTAACGAVGRTIGDLEIGSATGAQILAVRKADGLEISPTKDTLLEENDVVVGAGSAEEIAKLEHMFEPRNVVAK
jgi:K+/H+ antiporter YhaU regulatory subunit KhtT